MITSLKKKKKNKGQIKIGDILLGLILPLYHIFPSYTIN